MDYLPQNPAILVSSINMLLSSLLQETYARAVTAHSQVDEEHAFVYETLRHRGADALLLG